MDKSAQQWNEEIAAHDTHHPHARIEVVDNVADALKDTEADDEGGKA